MEEKTRLLSMMDAGLFFFMNEDESSSMMVHEHFIPGIFNCDPSA